MLVKIQLGEEEYIYLNLAQAIIVRFSTANNSYTIHISSINSTAWYRFEDEDYYEKAQDLIDEYTLHPLEENDTEKYRLDVNTGIWYGED